MKSIFLALAFLIAAPFVNAQTADDVIGIWLTEGGKSKVEVFKKDGKYYAKIIWLKTPNYEDGTPKIDKNNPDKSLNKRPIIGMEILQGLEWDDDEFEDGEIYDPESGKTYSCEAEFDGMDKLNVRGFIGFSMIGRTTVWTRVK
jgi:uncharacterized protein (DUF2147 family)